MLILERRPGETIVIGDNIRVKLLPGARGNVRIGIEAPAHVPVHREEIYERIRKSLQLEPSAPTPPGGQSAPRGGTDHVN
jgi:carbon storage regulator